MTRAQSGEDLFGFLARTGDTLGRLLGAANPFKEGDALAGLAAADEEERTLARALLGRTRVGDLDAHPLLEDGLHRLLRDARDPVSAALTAGLTFAGLKAVLLREAAAALRPLLPGLSSEAIAAVVKLMDDEELTRVSGKLFHPLPGSHIGAEGYLGARIQPNSPTDHPEDIRWQVFAAFSYAVGDLMLGANPVSSEPEAVARVERCLQELLEAFGLTEVMPHCVLAHIDVQAALEARAPGSTALWFQSLAGSDAANRTFGLTNERLLWHAAARTGRFGLYLETGQGADCTNGHAQGCDMVVHEARKYGLVRVLQREVARARGGPAWVHVNDVAGFIGPEVFRTREQLVRCCLEDLVMGKLHGLTIGLDVCATLHMDLGLDDLDWCLDRLAPARPAYLMALSTKIDPMLGYLSTGLQDHVRLRERFGLRVDDALWAFYQRLGVLGPDGAPTARFGDPGWVHLQFRRRLGDVRPEGAIRAEGRAELEAVRARGVFVAEGHGRTGADLEPGLEAAIRGIHADAKASLRAELDDGFIRGVPGVWVLETRARDREDYLLHPGGGERLSEASEAALAGLRDEGFDAQVVVSDGLNAQAISDPGHLLPCLEELRRGLAAAGWRPSPATLLLRSGRVRAGYRLGEALFGGLPGPRALLHLIGERPGSGHHTFSIYLTRAEGLDWGTPGRIDHDRTRVVSGIAVTALAPAQAARDALRILKGPRGS